MNPRAIVLAVLAALAACSTSIHLHSNWSQWSWFGTEPSSESTALAIDCGPEATRVTTNLRADGTAGELTLRLVDPDGVERHRQVVRSGRSDVTQCWPVREGTWTLHVEPIDFTGSYGVELSASDDPVRVRVEIAGDTPR